MKKTLRKFLPVIAALTISQAQGQGLVGITDLNQIFVMSNVLSPAATTTPVVLSGLTAGQAIVGLDYRPATGELYAMGYNSSTGAAQLYKVNPTAATLTAINTTPVTLSLGSGAVGFDFNPTVDRIRVVGANRKNYRLNPVTGGIAATDSDLGYALTDPNVLNLPSIAAVAYTNSYPGLPTTTLYDYDQNLNALSIQNPPNNGTLNTVGQSGVTVANGVRNVDMDIYYNPSTRTNTAYFSARATANGANALYTMNLATGAVSLLGGIGLGVTHIAVQPYAIPTPGALIGNLVYALLSGSRTMISFDSQNPRQLRSLVNITGVDDALSIVGMDFRPSNGMLYALGYQPGISPIYRLYTINTTSGVATAVSAGADTIGLGNTVNIGFDFNPTVDLIRVVSTLGGNFRLNPGTGSIAGLDSSLKWSVGDANAGQQVRVSTVGYINSYPGATSTTLYGINDSGSVYVTIAPPNNGRLNTVASGLYPVNPTDGTSDIDFYYDSTSRTNIGYLAANSGTSAMDVLYRLDPATGTKSAIDTIAYGVAISDIAVMPTFRNYVPTGIAGSGKYGAAPLVYPNPSATAINIVLPNAVAQGTYSISDLSGRVVLSGDLVPGSTSTRVPVSTLAAGVYMLQLHAGSENYAPVRISKL